ncbi:hypothetical protein GCM10017744_023760 [Streptomyces antimycoticus]
MQHAVRPDGSTVAATVLKSLKAENAAEAAEGRLGSYGAVVGATLGRAPEEACVDLTIDGPLLAPGIGAQGATPPIFRRSSARRSKMSFRASAGGCSGTVRMPRRWSRRPLEWLRKCVLWPNNPATLSVNVRVERV